MKIKPQKGIVQLSIEKPEAGVLDTSSKTSAVEYAEVLEVGDGCTLSKGDKVFVKSWAIDIISHNDKQYYFVAEQTNGILAVVK